ncbi:hypothetical protein AMR42_16940 [Limnothrix sp. PR1529]|nr:hypothetical protein BCR12_15750 [Limnothrix sp. P13C2]PIB04597.1 hypothetical protein AMR42_16940 [Limnothrix sp. PR1529]
MPQRFSIKISDQGLFGSKTLTEACDRELWTKTPDSTELTELKVYLIGIRGAGLTGSRSIGSGQSG